MAKLDGKIVLISGGSSGIVLAKAVSALQDLTTGGFNEVMRDPAALDSTYAMPHQSQNFDGYDNPRLSALFDEARAQANPRRRAELDVAAERLIMRQLPWIPAPGDAQEIAAAAQVLGRV